MGSLAHAQEDFFTSSPIEAIVRVSLTKNMQALQRMGTLEALLELAGNCVVTVLL